MSDTLNKACDNGDISNARQIYEDSRQAVNRILWYKTRAEQAEQNAQAQKADNKELTKGGLPRGDTYTRIMKATNKGLFFNNDDLKRNHITNSDLGILYRLLPLVDFQTGLLIHPNTQYPFLSKESISELLGYKPKSKTVTRALTRLIRVGVLDRIGKCFAVNYNYILSGAISSETIKARDRARADIYRVKKKGGVKMVNLNSIKERGQQ